MADWDEVVRAFGSDPDLVLRRQVAMALRDKGLALAELDRRVDALSAYTRLIESFDGDPDPVLRQTGGDGSEQQALVPLLAWVITRRPRPRARVWSRTSAAIATRWSGGRS